MMRLALAAALLMAVSLAGPGHASSPSAMKQGLADARQACLKAANLKNAAARGQPLLFSDTAGKTAILVTGTWRPAHMKGARATVLCLYDRASRTAETQEAPGWSAR
jgi:hypothetical protein